MRAAWYVFYLLVGEWYFDRENERIKEGFIKRGHKNKNKNNNQHKTPHTLTLCLPHVTQPNTIVQTLHDRIKPRFQKT